MASTDQSVRDAAAKLHDAIKTARGEGYRVDWPVNSDGLQSIAVSETAKVKKEPAPPAPPKTFGTPKL